MVRNVEASQQVQLILHYQQIWLPRYPTLRVTAVKNEGEKNIVTAMQDKAMGQEAGHPDLVWRLRGDTEYHFLYHELKKLKGKLSPAQRKWWGEFRPTPLVKGAITYGWLQHIEAVEGWLNTITEEKPR